jgi:hypothetical protein
MARTLTTEDVKQTLADHAAAKGSEIFCKYGPRIGWSELLRLLEDRDYVRYPCVIVFDALHLQAGEFAHPLPVGSRPEDGFNLYVHPHLQADSAAVVAAVLYQLVVVNYGAFASGDDAEMFGAAALGLTRDEFYARICAIADAPPEFGDDDPPACGCGH